MPSERSNAAASWAPDESPASPEHGTAIAGILVGRGGGGVSPGLLPRATLRLAETFLEDSAGSPAANVVAIATALDWLVQMRTAVINLSLTGADNLLLAVAVKRAVAKGTILVAAAGNEGADGPAAYDGGVSLVSGSSFAAPFVAAAAAVRIMNGAPQDVEVVQQALAADARDLGSLRILRRS